MWFLPQRMKILFTLWNTKISLGISAGLFILFCFILFGIIIKAIRKISKNQLNSVVTSGLNKRRKLLPAIYYFHFFFIRVFLSLMVLLTPFVNSVILWIVILLVQILICFAHLIKFYEAWEIYLQAIVRELYILAIIIHLLATQFTDQSSHVQQLKELKALNYLSTSLSVLFAIMQLTSLVYKIVKWIKWKCRRKPWQVASKAKTEASF